MKYKRVMVNFTPKEWKELRKSKKRGCSDSRFIKELISEAFLTPLI